MCVCVFFVNYSIVLDMLSNVGSLENGHLLRYSLSSPLLTAYYTIDYNCARFCSGNHHRTDWFCSEYLNNIPVECFRILNAFQHSCNFLTFCVFVFHFRVVCTKFIQDSLYLTVILKFRNFCFDAPNTNYSRTYSPCTESDLSSLLRLNTYPSN